MWCHSRRLARALQLTGVRPSKRKVGLSAKQGHKCTCVTWRRKLCGAARWLPVSRTQLVARLPARPSSPCCTYLCDARIWLHVRRWWLGVSVVHLVAHLGTNCGRRGDTVDGERASAGTITRFGHRRVGAVRTSAGTPTRFGRRRVRAVRTSATTTTRFGRRTGLTQHPTMWRTFSIYRVKRCPMCRRAKSQIVFRPQSHLLHRSHRWHLCE